MPEMVLAGPDGKSPAIDAMTGQPATLEELLRRRGLVGAGPNMKLGPITQAPQGTPVPGAAAAATSPVNDSPAAALAARNGATSVGGAASGGVGAGSMGVQQPAQPSMEAIESTGATEADIEGMEKLGLVALGTAAAYAAYRLMKRGGQPAVAGAGGMVPAGVAPNAGGQVDPGTAVVANAMDNAVDGGDLTRQPIPVADPLALPAPANQVAAPSTVGALEDRRKESRAASGARKAVQAAQGTEGQGTIQDYDASRINVKERLDDSRSKRITRSRYPARKTPAEPKSETAKAIKTRKSVKKPKTPSKISRVAKKVIR